MKVDCFGCSAGTAVLISLFINVISNSILVIGFCISSEFLKYILTENVFQFHWYFILLQTILTVFAIVILIMLKIHSSSVIIRIQVWLLGCIMVALVYEIVVIFLFYIGTMVLREDFDMIWKKTQPGETNKQAPALFYVFILVLPICFLGLKLYAATVAFGYRLKISEQMSINNNGSENGYFHSRQQLVTSDSPTTVTFPPSYDVLMESDSHALDSSTPPPRYSVIFN